MLKCEETRELMSLFIDNELTDAELAKFNEHIDTCKQCQQELKLLKDIVTEFNTIEEVELPNDFKQKLHQKLVETKKSMQRTNPPWYRNWRTYSGIAACILVAFTLKTLGYTPINSSKLKQAENAYVAEADLESYDGEYRMAADEYIEQSIINDEDIGVSAAPAHGMSKVQSSESLVLGDTNSASRMMNADYSKEIGTYRDTQPLMTYYAQIVVNKEQRALLLDVVQKNFLPYDVTYQITEEQIIVEIGKSDYNKIVQLVHSSGVEGELDIVETDVTEAYKALLFKYDELIKQLSDVSKAEQINDQKQFEVVTNEILELENKIDKYIIVIENNK